ncbi:MAG: nucleotidyltransferase domain-containing protein [Candidatus ainarchaeum sp.]|nr:nucleotidyltransferase domain-containing protein [Candidatus ainarchaeum sp.]
MNIENLESAKLALEVRKIFKDCEGIGLYGSWANGTNTKESDLDFWIKSENENEKDMVKVRRFVKEKLGLEASVIILTKKRLEGLKEKDFVFYSMLYNCFLLWGEAI